MMLFKKANTENFTYTVDDMSHEIIGNQQIFFFFGQLLGKALFDRIPVNVSLNHSILLALLGENYVTWDCNLESFRYIDNSVCNSLKFFRDNDLTLFEDVIDQYFVVNKEDGEERELKKNGKSIRVTNENKMEFIKLKCQYIAYQKVGLQLTEIQKGFRSVINPAWVKHLVPDELEAQLCG
jgi:HECT-domain (ubiquitin-transferase)